MGYRSRTVRNSNFLCSEIGTQTNPTSPPILFTGLAFERAALSGDDA
jgi:hypothetical protein